MVLGSCLSSATEGQSRPQPSQNTEEVTAPGLRATCKTTTNMLLFESHTWLHSGLFNMPSCPTCSPSEAKTIPNPTLLTKLLHPQNPGPATDPKIGVLDENLNSAMSLFRITIQPTFHKTPLASQPGSQALCFPRKRLFFAIASQHG